MTDEEARHTKATIQQYENLKTQTSRIQQFIDAAKWFSNLSTIRTFSIEERVTNSRIELDDAAIPGLIDVLQGLLYRTEERMSKLTINNETVLQEEA